MERFPDLVHCIEEVVKETKADLQRLEEIQPRRWFYCKHGLALRILLNKRLAKLQKITDAGWISAADGEELMEALWERIVQADQFFPRRAKRCCDRDKTTELIEANAWDDLEL